MKNYIKKKRLPLILTAVGALGGFLYWRFIGCNTGTCPIRSVWYFSTLWGAVAGYLIGELIHDSLNKRKEKREQE